MTMRLLVRWRTILGSRSTVREIRTVPTGALAPRPLSYAVAERFGIEQTRRYRSTEALIMRG